MKKKCMAILLAASMLIPMNPLTAAASIQDGRSPLTEALVSSALPQEDFSQSPQEALPGESETQITESHSAEPISAETVPADDIYEESTSSIPAKGLINHESSQNPESEPESVSAKTAETENDGSGEDARQVRARATETEAPAGNPEPSKTQYSITYILNGGKNASGNPASYSPAKSVTLKKPSRDGYEFAGWYKDKSYKSPITKIDAKATGNLTLFAKWKKIKEYAPKSNSAKITICRGSGADRITVKAKISRRLKSADPYYYLVTVDPNSGKVVKRAARSSKKSSVTYTLKTAEPNRAYALAKYAIAVKLKKGYKIVSRSKFVSSPEKAASNRHAYKAGKTKKGIQFTTPQEVEKADAKNTFLNLYASTILNNPNVTYKYNGKTYHFNDIGGYGAAISEFNRKGINVTLQLCLDWGDGSYQDLIAPKARSAGHILYTWNTSSRAAREKMEAIFSFVTSKYSTKDCHVSNWILGNEVNSCNLWNYKGNMSKNEFITSYAYAFRSLYNAAKNNWSNAKVFICLDHCWNTAEAGYSAKDFMDSFAKKIKGMQSGINWNVAYHAYPNPLTSPDYWNNSNVTSQENSPYVTMENIQVLTNYVKKHYGSKTRIILSEQGFSSSKGQNVQAAGIAYGYYKAACNPMIDAFIIRSYSDEPGEMAQGLYMGISGKEAYQVFKYMDTKKSARYTNPYLKVIGKSSWKNAVPGYKASRIYKMYRK